MSGLSGNQGNPLGFKKLHIVSDFPLTLMKKQENQKEGNGKTKKMPCRATVTAMLSQQVSWDIVRVICMWCACAKSSFAPLWWAISWNRWLFNDKTPLETGSFLGASRQWYKKSSSIITVLILMVNNKTIFHNKLNIIFFCHATQWVPYLIIVRWRKANTRSASPSELFSR